jgi:transposase
MEVDMNIRDHMTLEQLEALEKQEPNAYLAKRIRTIILSINGFTASDIERALGVPYRTIHVWVELYNKECSKNLQGTPRWRPSGNTQ